MPVIFSSTKIKQIFILPLGKIKLILIFYEQVWFIIMARQYTNIIEFLAPHNYSFLMTKEEYIGSDKKTLPIQCPENHVFTMTFDSFRNKRLIYTKKALDMKSFCSTCSLSDQKVNAEDDQKERIEKKTGHKVLQIDRTTRKVIYECGKCGQKNSSYTTNLLGHNKGRCGKCEQDHNKLDFDDLKRRVEAMGVQLLTKKEEYVNNKMLLSLICACGNPDQKKLSDIIKGKGCKEFCKTKKMVDTCQDRYGVSNPSQDPKIFAKIQSSLYRKKEFTFPITGRKVYLMGYEPQAITYLLAQEKDKYLQRKIEEDDILTGEDIPTFKYEGHVYHPDLFVKEDMILEVKGDWTFHRDKEVNTKKFKAVIRDGYKLRVILMYENGEVQEDLLFEKESDVDVMEEMKFREKGRRY